MKLKWTFEKTKEEASKYKRRSDFEKGNPSAYIRARKMKWINLFFPHKLMRNTRYKK